MSVESSICSSRIGVSASSRDEAVVAQARRVAMATSLPLVSDDADFTAYDFLLTVDLDGVSLCDLSTLGVLPVRVDFAGGATGYRRVSGGGRRQLIGRALGLRGASPRVVDATAGFGRDAFQMACLGCHVTMIERNSIMGMLLEDGLLRGANSDDRDVREILSRMSLEIGEAQDRLQNLAVSDRPEVVYVDPMHPPRRKSAAIKKELRICREIVGDDMDAIELLTAARSVALKRVVVKRARYADPISADVSTTYMGRSVRYDVYMTNLDS